MLTVELLQHKDVPEAVRLILDLTALQGKDEVREDGQELLEALVIQGLDVSTFKYWVVKDGDDIVGGAMCHFIYLPHLVKSKRLLIEGIYVRNTNMNNIGKYLLAAVHKWCLEHEIDYIIGECYDTLSRSNKYWKMLGAEAIGTLYRREV